MPWQSFAKFMAKCSILLKSISFLNIFSSDRAGMSRCVCTMAFSAAVLLNLLINSKRWWMPRSFFDFHHAQSYHFLLLAVLFCFCRLKYYDLFPFPCFQHWTEFPGTVLGELVRGDHPCLTSDRKLKIVNVSPCLPWSNGKSLSNPSCE